MANNGLSSLAQLKAGLERSKTFAGKVADTAAKAIEEIDKNKMEKTSSVAVTVTVTGWKSASGNTEYPYCYDIAAGGVTASDLAIITVTPDSMAAAAESNLSPICETTSGAVRIYAKVQPTDVISAELWTLGGV
ncbi:MAG: hypothetical protein NC203_00270 [Firmicutes bacterium]|nr:hypothetical protein [Bacillota bacterium]